MVALRSLSAALTLLAACSDSRYEFGPASAPPAPITGLGPVAGVPLPAGPGFSGEPAGPTMTCEQAVESKTSVGCEYWAVDMDAYFGRRGSGYSDAQGAQFAVALAHAAGGADPAFVTVSHHGAPVWCKPWGPVASNYPERADSLWCYPDKIECALGERCEIEPTDIYDWRTDPYEVCFSAAEGGGECVDSFEVSATGLKTLLLPRLDLNNSEITDRVYRIRASVPVVAYQFNPLDDVEVYSNDASLLLPTHALGREHRIVSREQTFTRLKGTFTVVGVSPGETRVFILPRHGVLNLESDCESPGIYCREAVDFTGTHILSDKPVAVFGGSEGTNAPNSNACVDGRCTDGSACEDRVDCSPRNVTCCADHLEEQLPPVETWGRRFAAGRSAVRGDEGDFWRVMAAEDGTRVTTHPHQVEIPVLDAGEWFEFESREDFEVIATAGVLLTRFLAAEHHPGPQMDEAGDAHTGDPAMEVVAPIRQWRRDMTFLVPEDYGEDWVTVVAPLGASVRLDGREIGPELWRTVGDDYAARPCLSRMGCTGWSAMSPSVLPCTAMIGTSAMPTPRA